MASLIAMHVHFLQPQHYLIRRRRDGRGKRIPALREVPRQLSGH